MTYPSKLGLALVVAGALCCGPRSQSPPPEPQPAAPSEATEQADQTTTDEAGPPAGGDPCVAPEGTSSPEEAALHCFESRVRPALLSLAEAGDPAEYRFGFADYIRTCVALTPTTSSSRVTGQELLRQLFGLPLELQVQTTALGSPDRLSEDVEYFEVTLTLRDSSMPVDGDMQLLFLLEVSSLETVLVYRRLHG